MEKKGWKITGITFIVLFVIASALYVLTGMGTGIIINGYDDCLKECIDGNSCFSFQYDVYEDQCYILDVDTMEELLLLYIEESVVDEN